MDYYVVIYVPSKCTLHGKEDTFCILSITGILSWHFHSTANCEIYVANCNLYDGLWLIVIIATELCYPYI